MRQLLKESHYYFVYCKEKLMTWIYQRSSWPAFVWDDQFLMKKLSSVRYKQGWLLGQMSMLGFQVQREASLTTLIEDTINTSAIEGKILNRQEVRSSIAKRLGIDIGGLVHVSRDVEGIVEIMLDATQQYDIPLTAERLFDWHAALFPTGRSGMNRITVSAWRKKGSGPMQVVSGPLGREQVYFEAPESERLEEEMNQFLKWFESDSSEDPILKAAIAHFGFVTIHPFDDGNGRIARAIADMALARSDESKERYYSMSSQIERERKEYYLQLESQQRSDLDITEWLDWFLDCLSRALDTAQNTLEGIFYKTYVWDKILISPVNERQKLILERMLNGFKGYINTSKYAKIAKCSSDTALRDINALVNWGILVKNPGKGRSTSYRLPTKEELRQD